MSDEKYSMWFAKRRENSVMDGVKQHVLKVLDTCEEMEKAVAAVIERDEPRVKQAIARLYKDEKAADRIEVGLKEDLIIGDLPSKERENLIHLVKRVDSIADWTKSAARNIEVIIDARIQVPENIWRNIQNLGHKVLEAAGEVKACTDLLGIDNDGFLLHKGKVDMLEHEIDDMYFSAKKELMMTEKLDPRVHFVIRDIIHGLENAADNCKDTVDLMYIIFTLNK